MDGETVVLVNVLDKLEENEEAIERVKVAFVQSIIWSNYYLLV